MSGERLRIVYLVSTLRRAGPTTQLVNLLRHLDRARFDPVVVTLSPETADTMLPSLRAIDVPVRSLAMSRARALVHRGWRSGIGRLAGRPLDARTVVHSQGVRGDVIAARHLRGLPRVATARNFPYDDYPLKFGRLPGLWMARSHLAAFRRHPQVVACSATLAQRLRGEGIEAAVIENGVDTATFRPAAAGERTALRASLGLPAGARVAVMAGALSTRKDPLLIVRAVRAIDDPRLVLVVLGDGPLAGACREAAAGDARIRFEGEVGDVTPWLRASDLLVSASRSEGLPNAVLEALACGLAVALSDIGPHRELLALAPGSGVAVPAGDGAAFAAAIARGAQSAGPADDARLATLFGAERMSGRYQALYARLAGGAAA